MTTIPATYYTLDPTAKTITLTAPYDSTTAEQILSIFNLSRQTEIYNSQNPRKHVAMMLPTEEQTQEYDISVSSGVITFVEDASMSENDTIQILISDINMGITGTVSISSVDGSTTTIKSNRKTAAQWTSTNPILYAGEIGIETDTRKTKYGDGSTHWNDLPYSTCPVDGSEVSLQVMRDTETNWTANTTPLLSGQIGYDTTTGATKIGDGSSLFSQLPVLGKQFQNVVTIAKSGKKGSANFICSDSAYTSDDDCIQAAIDYARINGISLIYIMQGTYNIEHTIRGTSNLKIIGIGSVIFNWGALSDFCITFKGVSFHSESATQPVNIGDTAITVNDASQISVDDLIMFYDDTIYAPTPADSAYFPWNVWKTGELHLVKNVSSNTISFYEGSLHNYTTSNNLTVIFIKPITFEIENICVQGQSSTDDYNLIYSQYTTNSKIKNCVLLNGGTQAIGLLDVYNIDITECYIANCERDGLGYGVSISNACAHIKIHENTILACRHCTASGGNGGPGQTRDYRVYNNILYDTIRWAVDAHDECESLYCYNNVFYNQTNFAIISAAKICEFKNNKVFNGNGVGIRHYTQDMHIDISHNFFENCKLIYYDTPAYSKGTATVKLLKMTNNVIKNAQGNLIDSKYTSNIIISENFIDSELSNNPDTVQIIDNCDISTGWGQYSTYGTVDSITVDDSRIKIIGTANSSGELVVHKTYNLPLSVNSMYSVVVECDQIGYPKLVISGANGHSENWSRAIYIPANTPTKYVLPINAPLGDIAYFISLRDPTFDTNITLITGIDIGMEGLVPNSTATIYIDNIYCRSGDTLDNTGIRINNAALGTISNNIIKNAYGSSIHLINSSYIDINNNTLEKSNRSMQSGPDYESSISLENSSNIHVNENNISDTDQSIRYGIREYGSSNDNILKNNTVSGATIAQISKTGVNTKISQNQGHLTENTGTATIPASLSSIAVTHGLAATPTKILLTPTSSTEGIVYYVPTDLRGPTTFTITMESAPTNNVSFDWYAEVS